MNRRTLFKGLVVTAAGLLAPKAGLVDAEDVRRFWALDRTMHGQVSEDVLTSESPDHFNYFQQYNWPNLDDELVWVTSVSNSSHSIEVLRGFGRPVIADSFFPRDTVYELPYARAKALEREGIVIPGIPRRHD